MTDEQVLLNVGRAVAYEPAHGSVEHGLIVRSGGDGIVFVFYASGVKATYTRDLRLLS